MIMMTSPRFVLFVVVFTTITMVVLTPTAYGWEFGKLDQGNLFVYDVCDYTTIDHALGDVRGCYELQLKIIDRAQSSFGPVWLAQVIIDNSSDDDDNGYVMYDIVLVDDGFNIYPYDNRYISESLHNTIFWMNHYARIISFDPVLGEKISTTSHVFATNIVKHNKDYDLAKLINKYAITRNVSVTSDDYICYWYEHTDDIPKMLTLLDGILTINDDRALSLFISATKKNQSSQYDTMQNSLDVMQNHLKTSLLISKDLKK